MELILWRHAEAEDREPDLQRALTAKGLKQASRTGSWLDRNLPHSCRIFASPAVRTVQTAEAIGRKFKILDALSPDATPQQVLDAINWPNGREPALIVGHQPTLGEIASLLISGTVQPWTIRKANIWWIAHRDAEAQGSVLRAVIAPDLLPK